MSKQIILCILIISAIAAGDTPGDPARRCGELCAKSMRVLTDPGGRVDWAPRLNRIVYDAPGQDGYYEVFSINPNGAEKKCLTCGNDRITRFHAGNPEWHPSAEYIAFQVVNPNLYRRLPHSEDKKRNLTEPGVGISNDVWIMHVKTQKVYQLTDVASGAGLRGGVLHPQFSPDGELLTWSERVHGSPENPTGEWVIRLADFRIISERPRLQNVRTFQPGKDTTKRLFETHGFSPDGNSLIYTANSDGQSPYGFDIYSFLWKAEKLTRLTHSPLIWDEHAHFTRDGNRIVWVSSRGYSLKDGYLKMELWSMNSDGSDQQRLTSFNIFGSPHYQGDPYGVVPADFAWGPDGKWMALYIISNSGRSSLGQAGRILLLEFH